LRTRFSGRLSPTQGARALFLPVIVAVSLTGPTAVVASTPPKPVTPSPPCDPASGPPLNARFHGLGVVALSTGWFLLETTDIEGSGPAATFSRGYQSGDTRTTHVGPGWTDNWQVRLRTEPPSDVLFTLPSGAVELFRNGLSSTDTHGSSLGYRVLHLESGYNWTVTDEARIWKFTSDGSLSRYDDGNGGWAEVRYDKGRPVKTVGEDGVGLEFSYRTDGRLIRVFDPSSSKSEVTFDYDAKGRLKNSTGGGVTQLYSYDGDSQRVTAISDGRGATLLALDYDDQGRVIRERDAEGLLDDEAVVFEYESLPDGGLRATATYPTSTEEPGWHPVQIAVSDSQGRFMELRFQPTSTQTLIGRYDYDPENRRIVVESPCGPLAPRHPINPIESIWAVIQMLVRLLIR
jgi:YD repeat-containing protein